MSKVKLYEVVREIGVDTALVLKKAKDMGLQVKTVSSSITSNEAQALVDYILTDRYDEALMGTTSKKNKKTLPKKTTPSSTLSSLKKSNNIKLKSNTIKKNKLDTLEPKEAKTSTTKKSSEDKLSKDKISNNMPENKVNTKKDSAKKDAPLSSEKQKQKHSKFLANHVLMRRQGGFFIVRKGEISTRIEEEKKKAELERKALQEGLKKTTASISSDANTATPKATKILKKARPKRIKQPQHKKGEYKDLGFMGSLKMADTDLDNEKNLVVLSDLSLDISDSLEEEKQSKQRKSPQDKKSGNKYYRRPSFSNKFTIKKSATKKRRRQMPKNQAIEDITIPKEIRLYEFAKKIKKSIDEVKEYILTFDIVLGDNDFLDEDVIELLADKFSISVNVVDTFKQIDYLGEYDKQKISKSITKTPVVTLMGHVDHGKTSLLDTIRKTKVADKEDGGITQKIGAYTVEHKGKKITFLDTPGHEAFTKMRAKGAKVTDIAIIVIAADDGVKPQTQEAINHALAAKVPIIFAINKIDKPNSNVDNVKTQLSKIGYVVADWGGDFECTNVSAKTADGIDSLLEIVLLQAEILDKKIDPSRLAKAVVVESSLDKGKGVVASVVVSDGTLKVGDSIVVSNIDGRVKILLGDDGNRVNSVTAGQPAMVVGLKGLPNSGDILVAVESDKIAKMYAQNIADYKKSKEYSQSTHVSLEEFNKQMLQKTSKSIPIILKSDAFGSLEAINDSLNKIEQEDILLDVIHSSVGDITQSDLDLAKTTSGCIILAFNVKSSSSITQQAQKEKIVIKNYGVIYSLIEYIESLIKRILSPSTQDESLGKAEIRDIFDIPKVGKVAGCIVIEGLIKKGSLARVFRKDQEVHSQISITSLKRLRDKVSEVQKGFECGIGLDGVDDIKIGDVIESYKIVDYQQTA